MTIKFRARHKSGFWVDSPLTPFTFPGGEAHIKIPEDYDPADYTHHVADVRGHEPQDLFMLSMFAQVMASEQTNKYSVFLPYLPGARADRGVPSLVTYALFISQLVVPDSVITIDPHSEGWVNTYETVSDPETIKVFPFERIIRNEIQDPSNHTQRPEYIGVVAPDKGAVDRASRAAKVMGVPVYRAEKSRDFETGKLTGFHMIDELPAEGRLLVVDDICDGGGTFIGLAEATGLTKDRVDLWVTHGIFSKGISTLLDHFGTIHTTDSYFGTRSLDLLTKNHMEAGVRLKVHKLDPYFYGEIDG